MTLLWSGPVVGELIPCDGETDQARIAAVMSQIRQSVDPCGESPQVVALLDKLDHSTPIRYEICVNRQSERNSFDRPVGDPTFRRTITWNPALQTVIEGGCEGDPAKPVLRDATASLLHELAHAAQDCDGRDPSAFELEAVRIENIYRRAVGLCQRTGYGEEQLPRDMVKLCEPGHCLCTSPAAATNLRVVSAPSVTHGPPRADAVTSADAASPSPSR